jgi:hypothetical protein
MPPEPKVPIEGVVCLPVTKNIKCLRGVCNERLKYEVEYSLKKGTSENSYLLKVGCSHEIYCVIGWLVHSGVVASAAQGCWHAAVHRLHCGVVGLHTMCGLRHVPQNSTHQVLSGSQVCTLAHHMQQQRQRLGWV